MYTRAVLARRVLCAMQQFGPSCTFSNNEAPLVPIVECVPAE